MIIRIVKMTFEKGKEKDFLKIFDEIENKIAEFPGCQKLELLNDVNHPQIFFTYSIWDNESSLEKYRFSELFKSTWARTKVLFSKKAEAWSVKKVV